MVGALGGGLLRALFCCWVGVLFLALLAAQPAQGQTRVQSTGSTTVTPQATPNPFSPDGDRKSDATAIHFGLTAPGEVTLSVRGARGTVKVLMSHVALTVGHHRAAWTGTSGDGKVVTPGTYRYRLEVSRRGSTVSYDGTVTVRLPVPRLNGARLSVNPVSPNGDKKADGTGFHYALSAPASVTIEVFNSLGRVKTVIKGAPRGAGPHSEGWTATDLLGHPLSNGNYQYVLSAKNRWGKEVHKGTVTIEGVQGGGPRWIMIRRGARQLYLMDGPSLVKSYPIAVGRPGFPTPIGAYTIIRKDINPTWYPPTWADEKAPVAFPKSPLGPRRLLLSDPSYGIHGTLSRAAIGRAVTHGCIRLYNEDIRQLFGIVPVGTLVRIVQ